jgi:hypothetical protein
MPICTKCNKEFPNRVNIDGKIKIINTRKYCLECSPYGEHNTKQIEISPRNITHKCICGETNPDKFYGKKRSFCSKCHNKYTIKVGNEKRKKAIEYLGGKCIKCGYDKYYGAIDLHHVDPTKKDSKFKNLRGWSWDRILKEIQNCVPLCCRCHVEEHYCNTLVCIDSGSSDWSSQR